MRFSILYRNIPEVRNLVIAQILEGIKRGMIFTTSPLQTNLFYSFPQWPEEKDILGFPLWAQCEELEFRENQLISTRVLVLDLEVIEVADTPPPTPLTEKPTIA